MALRFLKKLVSNWQIKFYMVILAIFLWIFVVLNQQYETSIDIPLEIVEMKSNKVLISDIPERVSVRFSGSGKDLLIMQYIQQAWLELDIHTINYFYDYPLLSEYIVTPPNLEVEPLFIIGPDTAMIRLEDKLTRRLPVIANVDVIPSPGYILGGEVMSTPDSVTVSGPQTVVRRLRRIETEKKIFEGLETSLDDILAIEEIGRKVFIAPRHIRVTIPIDKISERVINRIPVMTRRVAPGRRVLLEPSIIDVRLIGPATKLAELTPDSIQAFIDLEYWRSNVRDYRPRITLPEGFELVSINPEMVRVRVEVE